jgi:hypothetical protein
MVFVVKQLILHVKIVILVNHGTLFKKFAVDPVIRSVNSVLEPINGTSITIYVAPKMTYNAKVALVTSSGIVSRESAVMLVMSIAATAMD